MILPANAEFYSVCGLFAPCKKYSLFDLTKTEY